MWWHHLHHRPQSAWWVTTRRRVVLIVSSCTASSGQICLDSRLDVGRVKGRSRRGSALAIIRSLLIGFHGSIVVHGGAGLLVLVIHRVSTSIVLAVHVQSCIISGAGDGNQRKMIHADVGLDCIVRLPLPLSGFHDKILIISNGQLAQARRLYSIGVVNDDFGTDGLAVLLSGSQDCSHSLPAGIVLVYHLRIVGNDDGLSLIACKARRVKHIFRPAQFSTFRTIFQLVLEDARAGQDGVIIKISLGAVMLIDRYAVSTHFAPKDLRRIFLIHCFFSLKA